MSKAAAISIRLLTASEAANHLQVSPKTLETWRSRGGGPNFIQLRNRAIRYRIADLDAFIEQGVRRSTSDCRTAKRNLVA